MMTTLVMQQRQYANRIKLLHPLPVTTVGAPHQRDPPTQ